MKLPIELHKVVEGIHSITFTARGSFAKWRGWTQILQVNLPIPFNDLAPGDARSASLDLARFQIDRIRSINDPLFEPAYQRLWAEFGGKGEMESRETLAARFGLGPAMLYEIVFVRKEGVFAAVRDHTAIAAGGQIVVHLSHNLIAPEWRRTGLAGWMRALPLGAARQCASINNLEPGCGVVLAAEMEYADDPGAAIRLAAYQKAGFLKVNPRVFHYHQPDFRAPAEIDATGGARPLALQLLLRFCGDGANATTIPGSALRAIVSALYRMYGAQFRAQDMAALSGEEWPEGEIELLPPTF